MTRQEVVSNFKIVEGYLRRTSLVYDNKPLSIADTDQFVFCMKLWFASAFEVQGLHPNQLVRQMCSLFGEPVVDVLMVGKGLDELLSLFRKYCDDAVPRCSIAKFKAPLGHVAKIIISMISADFSLFLESPSPATAAPINQFLSFPRKILLRDIDNTEKLEEAYLVTEEIVSKATLGYASMIRDVIWSWNLTPDYDCFIPGHGPGRTAESSQRMSDWKYDHMSIDSRVELFYRRHGLALSDYMPEVPAYNSEEPRQSTTIFVPKTLKTKRVISAEPAALQYNQQGLMKVIIDAMDRSVLKNHINLKHQELSQKHALHASETGLDATVDYSAASDSISWKLLKLVLPTWLTFDLYCFKSDATILPSGRKVKLVKSSPMGSSTCFPVECIIFAAIAELACRLTHCSIRFRIYGDDVILPCEAVPKLIEISKDLGLQLNELKSYYLNSENNFREACGMEAFNGQDITPCGISRQFYLPQELTPATTQIFDLLRSFHNNLKEGGFQIASSIILQKYRELLDIAPAKELVFKNTIFSFSAEYGWLTFHPSELNWNLRYKYDKSLFRRKYFGLMARPGKPKLNGNQAYRYYEWLLKAHLRSKTEATHTHVYRVQWAGYIAPESVIRTSDVASAAKITLRWVME